MPPFANHMKLTKLTSLGAHALLAFLLLAATASNAWAYTLPALPLTFESPYVAPTGKVISVPAGGDFQAALNSAQLGDTIVLTAGATYRGPFTLPKKTTGSGWIYIQTSNYAQLPAPGTRVTPAHAVHMPKILANGDDGGVIFTEQGAHHYRFVGIEIMPLPGAFIYSVVMLGNRDTSPVGIAHHFTFDRSYIHGDANIGTRRGIAGNAAYVAVLDSHLSNFKEVGADTQAFWAVNTPGPIKIVNNYLESAGENILLGGGTPNSVELIPADVEIRNNTFSKPLAWKGSQWLVKNLLEFKLGIRILVQNNYFENCWAQNQQGYAFLLTPRNEDNRFPEAVVKDVTLIGNRFVRVSQGALISGIDGGDGVPGRTSQRTERVLIKDNTFDVTLEAASGLSDGRIFAVYGGPVDLTIDHNTGLLPNIGSATIVDTQGTTKADRFTFTNNIVTNGVYGFVGELAGTAVKILELHYSNSLITNNAIIDIAFGGYKVEWYPTGNFFPANNAAVGFVDQAGGDWRLASSSPYKGKGLDGRDLGANLDGAAPVAPPPRIAPAAPSAIAVE